jgi:hypothetical protein
MKKIVALGAIAALFSGMIFADEPAIDIKLAELSGNAEVKWGVDLDAGQHGFQNKEEANLKVNLWGEGTKETSGDDIWAEIQVKGKSLDIKNGGFDGDGNASVEAAKIHIGDFYVDIRKGGTTVGEYKPNMAVHSDKWAVLDNVGIDFTQGVQVGYDTNQFKFALDFRSYYDEKKTITYQSSGYGIKFGAELKDGDDGLVPGLSVVAGVGVNLSTDYKSVAKSDNIGGETKYEAEFDDDGNMKPGTDVTIADHKANIIDWDKSLATGNVFVDGNYNGTAIVLKDGREIAYGLKAGYKFNLDDTMYVQPSAAYRGAYTTGIAYGDPFGIDKKDKQYGNLKHDLAFGVMFGWGDANQDKNAGVPYLADDPAKKVSEGVSVIAYIPLPTVTTWDEYKHTEHDALQALIVPSLYLGETLVENLKAAAYGEIGIYKFIKDSDQPKATNDGKTTEHYGSVLENETSAIAFAAGLSYDIAVDEITVTPKAGFRYANGAYISNKTYDYVKSGIFETDLGFQKKASASDAAKQTWGGDWFNLTIGVDVGGLINNTTFSAEYKSANLSNAISDAADSNPAYAKDTKYYNVKNGKFTVGCKIAL